MPAAKHVPIKLILRSLSKVYRIRSAYFCFGFVFLYSPSSVKPATAMLLVSCFLIEMQPKDDDVLIKAKEYFSSLPMNNSIHCCFHSSLPTVAYSNQQFIAWQSVHTMQCISTYSIGNNTHTHTQSLDEASLENSCLWTHVLSAIVQPALSSKDILCITELLLNHLTTTTTSKEQHTAFVIKLC